MSAQCTKPHHHPDPPSLDTLQAALFYLTTQYSFHPCPIVAAAIVEHLTLLCNHPHIELIPAQNRVFAKLLNIWRACLPSCVTRTSLKNLNYKNCRVTLEDLRTALPRLFLTMIYCLQTFSRATYQSNIEIRIGHTASIHMLSR